MIWVAHPGPESLLVTHPGFSGVKQAPGSGSATLWICIFLMPIKIQIRDGIRKCTLSLGFLGKISRVLRLEVSTLVFCVSTRCYSWTNFIDWLFCVNSWNHRGSMAFFQVFCFVYTNKCCLFRKIICHVQTLFKH